jgi:hypothetical protein
VTTTQNGYEILLALVSDSHPGYINQLIVLAMNFPCQDYTQDVFEFYNTFVGTIRLCAIFMGGTDDMTSNHMINCFIQSCSHSKYVTQVSRFDHKDPSKKHLFSSGALPITLTNYLANSDSPLKTIPSTPPHGNGTPGNKIQNPYHCCVHGMF